MLHIYMNNFRGFSDTLIPLRQCTFLVGENSTGKSSVLKLIHIFASQQFSWSPEYALQEDGELGGFADIVSAWAGDNSFFEIGLIETHEATEKVEAKASFSIYRFVSNKGTPILSRYIEFSGKTLTRILFEKRTTKYKIETIDVVLSDVEKVKDLFRKSRLTINESSDGYVAFPKQIPNRPPVPIAMSIIKAVAKGEEVVGSAFQAEIGETINLAWIAPIRTKPKRFYDGLMRPFSPEGDHTPYLLRRQLKARNVSASFAEKLQAFGIASGLFEGISAHSFGSDSQSPFEIKIKFSGASLNINNVGYGVSQALPLVVEFIARTKGRVFAVQQPEVHLHPKAQAAFGDLIYEVIVDRNHSFVLETHSDYLIDRFRLNMRKSKKSTDAQVLFFERDSSGNKVTELRLGDDGKYPQIQPKSFRNFFINEERKLLDM